MLELIYSHGLGRIANELEKAALPSIRLIAQTANKIDLPLGISKFGGSPDLPPGYTWPEHNGLPLPFIAQINLAEIKPYDIEDLLPPSGMLNFFYDHDQFLDQGWHNPKNWKVLYNKELKQLQREVMPTIAQDYNPFSNLLPKNRVYNPASLTFQVETTLPDYSQYDDEAIERLGLIEHLNDQEEEAYFNLISDLSKGNEKVNLPIHRMLGYADPIQWYVERDCYREAKESIYYDEMLQTAHKPEVNDWNLLLQVDCDSVPNIDWVGSGRIYYFIRQPDLECRDFSKVWLVLQNT